MTVSDPLVFPFLEGGVGTGGGFLSVLPIFTKGVIYSTHKVSLKKFSNCCINNQF